MITLITSCKRPDLLENTIATLIKYQQQHLKIIIHEDSNDMGGWLFQTTGFVTMKKNLLCGVGQHKSIETFLEAYKYKRYYLHCEDDWAFNNSYDWIRASTDIMDKDPSVIKVLAREGSPHPCYHNHSFYPNDWKPGVAPLMYGYLNPWISNDGVRWCGFSWNPGITRLDILKQFMPFPKWEQDLAEKIHNAGYKVVELAKPVYKHTGDDRSTH